MTNPSRTPPRPDDTGAYRDRRRGGGLWWLWLLLGLLVLAAIIAGIIALATHHSSKKTPAVGTSTTAPASSSVATVAPTEQAAGPALVGGGGQAPTTATGDEAASGVLGTVLFASNSAAIDANGQHVIAAAAAGAKAAKATSIQVTGYTDTVAGQPVNAPLSQQRADAVTTTLRSLLPGVTVTAGAKGEADPVASNATAAGQAQNRRAVIAGS